MEEAVRLHLPHRERLAAVLEVLEGDPISLELGTFMAFERDPKKSGAHGPVGCAIGHYINQKAPQHLRLMQLNFREQLKAPIVADKVWQKYPNASWRHHTLHYSGPDIEGFGLTAVCLFFQLRPWDAQRLFYPAGYGYTPQPPPSEIAKRLTRFLAADRALTEAY